MPTSHRKRTLSLIGQRMAEDMRVRNMALRTIDTYTYHVERFSKHFGRPLDELGPEEVTRLLACVWDQRLKDPQEQRIRSPQRHVRRRLLPCISFPH